jgi:hypothetical protein
MVEPDPDDAPVGPRAAGLGPTGAKRSGVSAPLTRTRPAIKRYARMP